MVQTPFYPSRENWQPGPSDGRVGLAMRPASSVHGRELTIQQALKDCAGVPVKEYALFVILENGTQNLYSSSEAVQNHAHFTPVWDELERAAARGENSASFPYQEGMWTVSNDLDSEASHEDRRYSNGENRRRRHHQRISRSEESDEVGNSRKKRPRASGYRRGGSDDPPLSVIISTKTQQLRIGDLDEVIRFYVGRFKDIQQNACKIIGKVLVKIVEPKKQTHHPYTGGDAGRPWWWPQKQPGEPGYVRHKEPDHLLKNERVDLLVHILSLVVLPNDQQLECIRNQFLTVKKLEDTTMENMNNWFNDKEHPENMEKKKYLKEIFKIAKQHERYNAGQIDGTSFCNVMFGDRPVEDSSEDEQEETPIEEVQEHGVPARLPGVISSPDEMVSPMMQNLKPDVEPSAVFQTTNRRAPLVRYASQPHINDHQANFTEASLYSRGVNLGFQNNAQRGYGSPPVYGNPQPVYAGWNAQNQNMVSSGAPPVSFYTTSPQSAPGNLGSQYHLPALSTPVPQQSMLPPLATNPFEHRNAPQYDMGPAIGNQLRTGSHGHPHITHHGFPDYMANVNQFGQPDEHQHQLHQPEQR